MTDDSNGNDRFKTFFADSDEEVGNWIRGNGQLPLLIASVLILAAFVAVAFGA